MPPPEGHSPRGYKPPRRRWGLLAAIGLLHVAALAGLVHVFSPNLTARAIEAAGSLVTVTVTAPPEAEPLPDPAPEPDEGAAADEGARAAPREVVAPPAPLPRPTPAAEASSTSEETASGARDEGAGTGAGGEGQGIGAGRFGEGRGGVPVTRPEKIAGEINDARDYPTPPGGRALRQGRQVVVYMTVGTDGRARDCRVVEPSPDPEADRITCRLAEERFRFRPARNAAGQPVEAQYGWRQRWF